MPVITSLGVRGEMHVHAFQTAAFRLRLLALVGAQLKLLALA